MLTREFRYAPSERIARAMERRDPRVFLCGPSGTGKSRANLEKLNACALKYPRMRGLIIRATRESLTQTTMVTFREQVRAEEYHGVRFHSIEQAYKYPNGSVLCVAGLNKPSRHLSAEYDLIYIPEATEVEQQAVGVLTTRLRNGVLPYQQLLGDCNPDAPTHWIRLDADAGKLTLLETTHEDNPRLYQDGAWTEFGKQYIETLEALPGFLRDRYLLGKWVAAEGIVYTGWDRHLHLVPSFPIPQTWPRYWAIDYGYTNPFVCQMWAEDPDGRLYLYRELYHTQRIVADHARNILTCVSSMKDGKRVWHEPKPRAVVTDHDAEDRATFERETGLYTTAATKDVSPGIQAVARRLRKAGDGKPRLFVFDDALVEVDPALQSQAKPYCTAQEFDRYIWDTGASRKVGEEPRKLFDHGMDAMRYLIMHRDAGGDGPNVRFIS